MSDEKKGGDRCDEMWMAIERRMSGLGEEDVVEGGEAR